MSLPPATLKCPRCGRRPRAEFARTRSGIEPAIEVPLQTIEEITILRHKPCSREVWVPGEVKE